LERRVLLWSETTDRRAVRPFFTKEMGARRCHTLRVVCMDMWAPYAKLVREHARMHRSCSTDSTSSSTPRGRSRKSGAAKCVVEREGESGVQAQPLVAAEESLESHRRPKGTPFDHGAVEHAIVRPTTSRNLSSSFGTTATRPCQSTEEMDAFGDGLALDHSRGSCECCGTI